MNFGRKRQPASMRRPHAWSPRGWLRTGRYRWLRVLRLSDSPHRISRGVFAGTFIAFTPLFGLHFIFAPIIAWLLKGSVLASLAAVFVCNPLTFPPIAFASYRLGTLIIGGQVKGNPAAIESAEGGFGTIRENSLALFSDKNFDWQAVVEVLRVIFLPYLVGGLILGTVAGVSLGWVSYRLISAYQKRRPALRRTVGNN